MKNLKIAYLSWGNSPCNYRRFAKFSQIAGLQAELYNHEKKYDIIVITQNSDLSVWGNLPRSGTKLVFDFVDSYFKIEPWELEGNLRGLFKFLTGQHRYLEFNYYDSLRRMMERADAVVCATPEQKTDCLKFNFNVSPILDFNSDQIKHVKTDYHVGETINFAWEGMGANAWAFQEIAPVLKKVQRERPIALHLVTDLKYRAHYGPWSWNREVKSFLKNILGDIPVYLYEWNSAMLSVICSRCDIALLPIPRKPAIYWAKPENRLLMLWRMGLPVLTSSNPAFFRCMQASGNEQACENLQEWEEKLEALIFSKTIRCDSARRGHFYAEEQMSDLALCEKWNQVLKSVM